MKFCRWYYLKFCSTAVLNGDEFVRQSYLRTRYRSLRHKVIKLTNGKIEKDKYKPPHPYILKYSLTKTSCSIACSSNFECRRQKYFKEKVLKNRTEWKLYRT